MYESFYKLHPTPFRLTPDPHFFFESETHKRGLAYLRFAFYQREGFVAITGAPGTGKTELTLNLIEELPHNKVTLAKIVTTNLDADDLLDLVAASFEINIDRISKGTELKKLEEFFISQARTGKQVLLIIDEAHNLSVKSLLELSMLENFQLDEKPIMQCFLLGQLPLEEKLNLPELEPLKQRVIASARLESLDQQETRGYIIHRLSKSGWNNNPTIHDEAFFFIYRFTKGIPRKINSLCNRLLLNSYVEDRHDIDVTMVHKVIQEIQQEAVGESLDLDFANMQTNLEFTSDSQHDENRQANLPEENVLSEENKAQQPATTNSENSRENDKQDQRASPNEFYIPEFLKKTQDKSPSDKLTVLKESREPEAHESQKKVSGAIGHKQYQSDQNDNTHQGNTDVATAQHITQQRVTQQRTSRSSNLLDKELKFLASLAESNAFATPVPATPPEQKPEPVVAPEPEPNSEEETLPAVENKSQQKTTTIRTVIIDESVYDFDEDIDGLIDTNNEKEWLNPKTSSTNKNPWRETVLAAIVVGSLIISISWLFDGDPDQANIVATNKSDTIDTNSTAKNQTETEIFSNAAPIDVELPVISATNSNLDTTDEVNNTHTAETSVALETTTDFTSDVTTASATETPLVADKTLVTASSDSSGNTKTGELDTQLTQILEKTGPENVKPSSTADRETIAATETDSHDSSPHKNNSQGNLATLSTKNNGNSLQPDETITANDTSKIIDSKAVAVQENNPTSALVKSPIASPLEKPTEPVSVGNSPDTAAIRQQPATTGASIAMPGSDRGSISRQPEPAISNADLTTLLSRLSAAYETGNLQQLVSTFAADINSSEGSDRRQMLKEYQRLFNITDKRQLTIQDVKWSTKDRKLLGKGDFELSIREKGSTKYTTYQGKISFAVAKESNAVVIKKLDYNYGQ